MEKCEMAQLIGVVSKVVGTVVAIAADGTRRNLMDGDRLYAGDQVETGATGAVAIHLQNGNDLTLGRDSSLQMSAQTLAGDTVPHVVTTAEGTAPSDSMLTDVERIQEAIAAGLDPSVDADPTAAGTTPAATGGDGGGGHSFVLLEAIGGAVDPSIGFATVGPTAAFLTPTLFVSPLITTNALAVDNPVAIPVINTLTFNEASLADGSNAGASALRGTGSFTISAPDGLTNLSVAGTNVLVNGAVVGLNQTITTSLGNTIVITGLNTSTGLVSYAYTLNGAETHAAGGGTNNLAENITLVAGDSNGSVASGAIVVNITDDVPRAFNDFNDDGVNEIIGSTSGNVLDNDVQGADRIASGPITAGTFTGQFGTLVLSADGSYTYTINPNAAGFIALGNGGSGTENFTYTLRDADGDTSTATLSLDVNNADNLTVSTSTVTLNEANLALGSAPNSAALTQSGSFVVNSSAGLSELSVNGVDILADGVVVGLNQRITTASGDTVVVTGLNRATGVVTYNYTLVNVEAHEAGAGSNNLALPLSISVVDNNGNGTSGSINVNITDDVPRAAADINGTVATTGNLTLSGNVLTNDIQGADRIASGPISGGTFTGTYGTLTLSANGTYSYTLNPGDPDFAALPAGGRGTETFTYTLNDADGDTSTATLTLTVGNGNTTTPPGSISITPTGTPLVVNEANLALGSAPNVSALTQTGTFTVAATAGLNNLSINGVAVLTNGTAVGLNQAINTGLGNTVRVTAINTGTGAISYTYTLNANETHAAGGGANNLAETLSIIAGDRTGTSATGSVTVNVIDDLPRAVADSNANLATQGNLTLTGNVLTNDVQGADRIANGAPVTAQTLTGTYGTLVLNANGSYTYTLNPGDADFTRLGANGRGTETFTYTLSDSDGDTSTATLTLNVGNSVGGGSVAINPTGTPVLVNEANLALGSAPNAAALTQTGTFNVAASAGLNSLSVNGVAILTNGVLVALNQDITTALGNTVRITGLDATNGNVTYTYTLTANEAHTIAPGTTLTEALNVVASDANGGSASGSVTVGISDDVPRAVNDTNGNLASQGNLTLTGNVLTNDVQGADRVANGAPVTAQTLTGTYGTLVLNANGTYTYTLNPADADFVALPSGGRATETFTYTLRDSDNDTSTATLTLNVGNTNAPSVISINPTGNAVVVNEASLALGSAPNAAALTQTGTFNVATTGGLNNLSINGTAILTNGVLVGLNQELTTALGNTLRITGLDALNGNVTYTYTLTANEAHTVAPGTTLSEAFTVLVSDRTGAFASAPISVSITDDAPRAVNDTNANLASQSNLTLTGNVLTNDVQGADRVANGAPVTAQTLTGTYGTLVLNANGTYTYTLNPSDADFVRLAAGARATETFTYSLRDSDNDTSTATLTLNVGNTSAPSTISITPTGSPLVVNEANLALGSAPNAAALTQTGTFNVAASGGLNNLAVNGVTILANGVLVGLNQDITTGLGNTLKVTGLDAITGAVTYTYTLTANEAHTVAPGTTLSENLLVTVSDRAGVGATGAIPLSITDDAPRAVNDSNATTADSTHLTLTGNVLTNDTQGADRVAAGPITGGTFTGTYGTLVLAADGSYTYTLNTNDPDFTGLGANGRGTEQFSYTLRDSDGDTSNATLTLNVGGSRGTIVIGGIGSSAGDVVVNESNLALGSAPNAAALTQSGTFTVNASAGFSSLSVAGVAILTNGVLVALNQPITTPLGNTLTITSLNADTGVVIYTYALTGNETHPTGQGPNSLIENLPVLVTDANGTTGSASLVTRVADDVPRAVADSNTTTADSAHVVLTGNVLTNDIQGADRITSGGPITAQTLTGTYGTLTLLANGSYTYTLNTSDPDYLNLGGNGGIERFNYTLNDSDGDISTGVLTLNVGGKGTITIGGIGAAAGDVMLNEANLALGSAPNAGALTQNGTFTVTATAGLANLSIGGVVVLSNGALVNPGTPITTPLGNTVRIFALDPTTGLVSYSYTLNANERHPDGNGTSALTENLAVVATDRAGTSASSSIVVKVSDDVPTAANDTNGTTADATHLTLTGNVLTNDIQGADRVSGGTPVTAGTFTGTYGTLTLNANGSYTYTLNPGDPDFVALGSNGRGTERFTYSLRDSDNDVSTATLILNVGGATSTVTIGGIGSAAGDVILNEANLNLGSAPNPAALTQSGSFTVTTPAGLFNLSIAGVTVLSNGSLVNYGAPITTASGNVLRITSLNASSGTVAYTYTLAANEAHPDGQGRNVLTEQLAVVAGDRAGASASSNIVVKIGDDVPTANNDTNANLADSTHLTLTGNVLTNDVQGADRVAGGAPITPATLNGVYGSLTLAANGSYTYTLNPADPDFIRLTNGARGTESFTYTLRDADGDLSTATLTLTVGGKTGTIVIGDIGNAAGDVVLNEANLNLGSAPNAAALTQTDTFTVNASAGFAGLSINNVVILANGSLVALNQPITTALGNIITVTGVNVSTGVVTYTYQLTANEMHALVQGPNLLGENIAVSATDTAGLSTTANIVAQIRDDVPTAANDSNGSIADEAHVTLTGNVLSNDTQGADRLAAPITAATFTGTYGTLVLAANGSYTYTLNPSDPDFTALTGGATGRETFTYTLNDSDGDKSTATLVLNVQNANDPVTLVGLDVPGGEIVAYEANLNTGSSPDVAGLTRSGNFTITAPDGLATLSVAGASVVSNGVVAATLPVLTSALGNVLTITGYNQQTGVLSYTYRLTGNEQHTSAPGVNVLEEFNVVAVDRDGDRGTAALNIRIVDDKPIAVDDVNGTIVSALNPSVTGSVLTNDTQGADRVSTGPILGGTFTGTYGTLVLAANGTYTYTLNTGDNDFRALANNQLASDSFTYTLRDSDGDTSTAQLELQLSGGGSTPIVVRSLRIAAVEPEVTVASPSADFTAATLQTIALSGASTGLAASVKNLARAEFTALSGGMAASLLVAGVLAATTAAGQVDQNSLSVVLKQGETLTLDTAVAGAQLGLHVIDTEGNVQVLSSENAFTAAHDGTYTVDVINAAPAGAAEDYTLGLTIGMPTTVSDADPVLGTATDAHFVAANASTAAVTGSEDQVILGTDGDDVLIAGAGNDSLFGGSGDDLLIAGAGNDLLNGGEGNNTASFQNATAGVQVSLAVEGPQDTIGAGHDTLVSIQNLIGSSHDDVLIGNDLGNVLNGGLGNDTLIGGAGNDTLIGGLGNNLLTGGEGNDTFLWGQGNSGHDTVTDFTPGSDTLDLSQLLQGHNESMASLDDYLHFKVTGTGDGLVSTIEVSSSAGATPTQTIDLQGVNLASQYGVAPGSGGAIASNDAATIISGMLTDHSLKVDTV
jgi:VCBS repeat-containing protein